MRSKCNVSVLRVVIQHLRYDEMGGTCSAYGRYEKFIQNFSPKSLKGTDHLEDVNDMKIFKCVLKKRSVKDVEYKWLR